MKRILPVFAFVLGFVILGLVAAFVVLPRGRSPIGLPAIGGPFALSAPDGRVVTDKDVAGEPFLVFFGYTHCPDVCPASLTEISSIFHELGDKAKIKALFITVDPARDTPAVMKEYMSSFDPRIIGLSGTPDQTTAVERAYKAYAKQAPDEKGGGSYTMDHTAITYLMDKSGNFVNAFNVDQAPADAAAELRKYL